MATLFFILFAGMAIGCALSLVTQRNPLYCAISLIGVFLALAGLYTMLAAPFIAAVQVIVYAGAIMVLVVFVIMLLNVEEEEHRVRRKSLLILLAVAMAAVLFGEAVFVISFVGTPANVGGTNVGLTGSIGEGLFTRYLLPFEITSVLLLMAIVGAMTLARRALPPKSIDRWANEEAALETNQPAPTLRDVSAGTASAMSSARESSAH
ncbi:MAG TPA: NADH-quinone oxidoreductase subunit J [Pyrinomonadaceae bacterium]|jgi:NADH-quinone oxidoreductase subunit J|nr:NADH-quinone oxidoreductase subunit J [Pyrinomonadaceae bacterium]